MSSLKEFAISRNKEQSELFSSPDARLVRMQYRSKHPTEIAAFKCMDGRLNLAVMTETPPGIIQPFRNMGGRFNLGWPFFGEIINDWVSYSVSRGRDCVVFVTYHFSKGDHHRGCAGFAYETEAARASSDLLRVQIESVFGKAERVVYPILVGIETDEDALVFHGINDQKVSISDIVDHSEEAVLEMLEALYPDMRLTVRKDLLRLIKGNQRHIKRILSENRPPIELDHREQIIAVGRGFDWLHLPNRALIIGPYDGWQKAIKVAGSIVLNNIKEKRVDEKNGALLLISALSLAERGSASWNVSVEKAKFMHQVAYDVLKAEVPEIIPHLTSLAGVVDSHTRLLHQIEV